MPNLLYNVFNFKLKFVDVVYLKEYNSRFENSIT